MKVQIIQVPYHLGHRSVGMGRGPLRLLEDDAVETLRSLGCSIEVEQLEVEARPEHEIGASLEVVRQLAARVRDGVQRGLFPLVLSGNCHSSWGTLSGLAADVGIVWFDAHGDLNTPDTTPSGFFDGTALAAAMGRGWGTLCRSIPGFRPTPEARVVLVGARDLDPGEEELLRSAPIARVTVDEVRESGASQALAAACQQLETRVGEIYLHVDLDVLDPAEATINEYAAAGGLTLGELCDAIRSLGRRFAIRAAALAAYDPGYDPDGRGAQAGRLVMRSVIEALPRDAPASR